MNCLDVLGVKVTGNTNRRQLMDLAMQQALSLLAVGPTGSSKAGTACRCKMPRNCSTRHNKWL